MQNISQELLSLATIGFEVKRKAAQSAAFTTTLFLVNIDIVILATSTRNRCQIISGLFNTNKVIG